MQLFMQLPLRSNRFFVSIYSSYLTNKNKQLLPSYFVCFRFAAAGHWFHLFCVVAFDIDDMFGKQQSLILLQLRLRDETYFRVGSVSPKVSVFARIVRNVIAKGGLNHAISRFLFFCAALLLIWKNKLCLLSLFSSDQLHPNLNCSYVKINYSCKQLQLKM